MSIPEYRTAWIQELQYGDKFGDTVLYIASQDNETYATLAPNQKAKYAYTRYLRKTPLDPIPEGWVSKIAPGTLVSIHGTPLTSEFNMGCYGYVRNSFRHKHHKTEYTVVVVEMSYPRLDGLEWPNEPKNYVHVREGDVHPLNWKEANRFSKEPKIKSLA